MIAQDEVYVGRDLGRHDYEITPELVRQYAEAVDDHNPWYAGSSPFGGPVAPTLLLHSEVYRFHGWYLPYVYGNLHAKQEWDIFHPMLVGDRISTRSTVIDRYVKRGRDYVVNEVSYFGEDGRLLSRSRTFQSFLMEESTGIVVDKERERQADRRIEVGAGEAIEHLPPLEKTVTLDMCWKFSGPARNYHNDVEEAKKLGFPDIVVQGMMSVCFLSELMTCRFGEGWYQGGRMSVSLVNVLWGADGAVTCRGALRELTPEGAHRRAHCEIWAEKPGGTVITVGRASAVV